MITADTPDTNTDTVDRPSDVASAPTPTADRDETSPDAAAKFRPRWLPAPLLTEWDWQRAASCVTASIDLFFPDERHRLERRRKEAQAKLICRRCPALSSCREYALAAVEPHGIWGALTTRERETVLRRRRRGDTEFGRV
jgi:WhiB family redox-sensing transcriptional regulator